MRSSSQIAALCLAAIATSVCARPFSVADLLAAEEFGQLAAEEFGQLAFTPDGSRLVFERQVAFEKAGPFDYDAYPPVRRSRIYVADLTTQAPPRLLIQAADDEGHTAGPISPGGRAMVVLRLKGRDWEAGVVTLASGQVRWLGVIPELAQLGQTITWRSDHELVIAARSSIPVRLRAGWQARETLQAHWATAASGAEAISEAGTGAFAGDTRPAGRLVLADTATGILRTLALGDFYDLQISPDGRQVAAMAQFEALAPDPAPRVVATPNRRRNLVLADLISGEVTMPCEDCDLSPHLMAWSPEGDELLVHGRRQGQAWDQAVLLRLSMQGARPVSAGSLRLRLDQTTEGHVIPPAGWLAGAPIALMGAPGGRADWYRLTNTNAVNLTTTLPQAPPAAVLANDGEAAFMASAGAIWRVDPSGGRRIASPAFPLARPGLSLSSRERRNHAPPVGWYAATESGEQVVRSTGGQTAPSALRAPGGAQVCAEGACAEVSTNPAGGLDLVLVGARPTTVMTLNKNFAAIDFARVETIVDHASGAKPLTHHLLLPPRPLAFPPPLIVVPYPGLEAYPPPRAYGGGNGRFPANAELMAAAGYAVLIPALPRSRDLEPGQGLADQILAAVDLAAAKVGGFDAARPILWGHSFGGYTALMAAAQSERFAAIIALAAPTNLSSVRGVFDLHGEARPREGISAYLTGWSEAGQANLGASPWEAPGLYFRNSPVFQAHQITAPVLLIQGDGDFVRLGQGQEMFSALARQAKDVTLLTAYGEGHIVSSPGNLAAVYDRTFAWLAERRLAASPRQTQSGVAAP